MEADELLKKRITELAEKAYQNNIYTFSSFLGMSELSDFYAMQRELSFVPQTVFGGYEGAERCMIRFGSEELFGYPEEFPVVCLKIRPLMQKFADDLGHRDFLGALMGAGIARETIGDICVGKGQCDFFVTAEIAPYILQNFTGAGRTKVHLEQIPLSEVAVPEVQTKEIRDTVASLRLDSIIASGFRIGRSAAAQYVTAGKVAIDGLPCEKPDKPVEEGSKVSVRGLGKIKLKNINGQTQKGRISVIIHRYI